MSGYWYECQERAMAPGIGDGWPEVIEAPHTKNARLVRRELPSPSCQGLLNNSRLSPKSPTTVDSEMAELLKLGVMHEKQVRAAMERIASSGRGEVEQRTAERDAAMLGQRKRQAQFEQMSNLADEAIELKETAETALQVARETISGWLKENNPGGWIDKQREALRKIELKARMSAASAIGFSAGEFEHIATVARAALEQKGGQ